MTKLYLRDTTNNTGGYVATELSTALPVGTANPSGHAAGDLETTAGASVASSALTSLAQTAHQDGFIKKFISDPLTVSQVNANTWTLALNFQEQSGQANAFLVSSIYVLKSDDTVRGYIYDSDTPIGTEWGTNATDEVNTISGSAVSGVVSTDRLCIEVWAHAEQAMAAAIILTLRFNGTVEPIDGTANNNPASYIETPQDLFAVSAVELESDPVGASSVTAVLIVGPFVRSVPAGTSTINADLTNIGTNSAAASVVGNSTITASLTAGAFLRATIAGTSAVQDIEVSADLNTGSSGDATITAALTVQGAGVDELAATIAGTSSITADLDVLIPLAAAIAGGSNTTANLIQLHQLTTAIAGTSTITAALTIVGQSQLSTTIVGGSSASANLVQVHQLSVSILGGSSATANLAQIYNLLAAINGGSTASANLLQVHRLATTITGESTVIATLFVQGADPVLVTSIAGQATVTANLTLVQALAGSSSGTSSVSGDGEQIHTLVAAPAGTSSMLAAMLQNQLLSATIVGVGTLQAGLSILGGITRGTVTSSTIGVGAVVASSQRIRNVSGTNALVESVSSSDS